MAPRRLPLVLGIELFDHLLGHGFEFGDAGAAAGGLLLGMQRIMGDDQAMAGEGALVQPFVVEGERTEGVHQLGVAARRHGQDELAGRLVDGREHLVGDRSTEADVRLFVTLVRFDVAHHGLFKCNLRRIADYPALSAYHGRTLAMPGVRETVSIDQIRRGYYSVKALNPTGIVPVGPDLPRAVVEPTGAS